MSVEAGKRPPQTRSTAKDTEFRVVFVLILIETGENPSVFLIATKSVSCAELP